MENQKSGKTNLSERDLAQQEYGESIGAEFGMQDLDPVLKKELADLGLTPRWINYKQYNSSGNIHRAGWKAYKRKAAGKGTIDFALGTSPEGYILRNDLILAVKTIENQEKYRRSVELRTKAQELTEKDRAAQLRQEAKSSGSKGKFFAFNSDDE